jgi:hypothetical protein
MYAYARHIRPPTAYNTLSTQYKSTLSTLAHIAMYVSVCDTYMWKLAVTRLVACCLGLPIVFRRHLILLLHGCRDYVRMGMWPEPGLIDEAALMPAPADEAAQQVRLQAANA